MRRRRLSQQARARVIDREDARSSSLARRNLAIHSATLVTTSARIPTADTPEQFGADHHFTRSAALRIARGGMTPPLRGSLELLVRQDNRLIADGLERIETEQDLSDRIAHHLLVPIPASDGLAVNDQLSPNHRYCRRWTAQFLADLALAHETEFRRPLEVTSAVRPVSYQEHLTRINGNAAPAQGDIVSPHVMGATVDIGKKGMSWREISWMRRRLLDLEMAGKIDVEEEFQQACFHITVYRSYLGGIPGLHSAEGRDGEESPGARPAAIPISVGRDLSAGGQ